MNSFKIYKPNFEYLYVWNKAFWCWKISYFSRYFLKWFKWESAKVLLSWLFHILISVWRNKNCTFRDLKSIVSDCQIKSFNCALCSTCLKILSNYWNKMQDCIFISLSLYCFLSASELKYRILINRWTPQKLWMTGEPLYE